MSDENVLTLSLISHTNVGKTTLARTLLRRDIGEVADQAHVTLDNVEYTLIETPSGAQLRLWDTPGFGNSAKLLNRLRRQTNPVGWLLNQTWDRIVNRPLWCSQQAAANVRDEADVVVYLVNAAEDPQSAGYARLEMQVLQWIGKPVILLLNQTGEAGQEANEANVATWRRHVEPFEVVRDAISLDAFTRCWVQEGILLERVGNVLPEDKQLLLNELLDAWTQRHQEVLNASMDHLCDHLLSAARDREEITKQTPRKEAQGRLTDRLEVSLRSTIDRMIDEHGIEGSSREVVAAEATDYDAPKSKVKERNAGMLGSIVGGALYGLGADIAAGGLTFGGGFVVGAIAGGLSALGLAGGYNKLFVTKDQMLRWKEEALDRAAAAALVRYLAVAHFGRGRGEWRDVDHWKHWGRVVETALVSRLSKFHDIWQAARSDKDVRQRLRELVTETTRHILLELYPGVERFVGNSTK